MKTFNILSKLLIIVCLLVLVSCKGPKNVFKFIEPDSFVFIEYTQTEEGKQISGKSIQGPRIDGPGYTFNKEDRTLQINRKPGFSIDSAKVVIGNGKILKGVAGNGVSLYLTEIKKLPFTTGEITISKISKQGITFTIKNKSVFLKAGEEWKDIVTKTDTFPGASQSIVEYKITKTLNYLGKLPKKSVVH